MGFRVFVSTDFSMLWYSDCICICLGFAILSLPQFCRYIIECCCAVLLCIYCVCYSNNRLFVYIVSDVITLQYFFIRMCAHWHFCLCSVGLHVGSFYPAVVSYLFIPMFIGMRVFHAFAIASVCFHFFSSCCCHQNPLNCHRAKLNHSRRSV